MKRIRRHPRLRRGQHFGRLVCLGYRRYEENYKAVSYLFRCSCGKRVRVIGNSARGGRTKSCGCLRREITKRLCVARGVDLTGRKINRWTVMAKTTPRIYRLPKRTYKLVRWLCRCDCGNTARVTTAALQRGSSKSCGCLKRELAVQRLKHGLTRGGVWKIQYTLLHGAKTRARRHHLPFDLEMRDVTVPTACPVLGIPLIAGKGVLHHGSPSIDRIRSTGGYTKDNIRVISHRANSLKRDAALWELEKVMADLRAIESAQH